MESKQVYDLCISLKNMHVLSKYILSPTFTLWPVSVTVRAKAVLAYVAALGVTASIKTFCNAPDKSLLGTGQKVVTCHA